MKKYDKYIKEKKLHNDAFQTDDTIDPTQVGRDKYKKLFFNILLMSDVVDDSVNESSENKTDLIFNIEHGNFETTNVEQLFFNSLHSSKYKEYLTLYTIDELKSYKLFKINGYDIGFALDGNNIIAVHNNTNIGGLGTVLMNAIIKQGGTKLDHFDGFLTGFYKKHNFKNITNNLYFNKKFAPDDWNYNQIDINNPNISIYANEIKSSQLLFNEAKKRYDIGMPDIVYRTLKL